MYIKEDARISLSSTIMKLKSLFCIVAGVAALTHQVRQSDTCASTPTLRAPKPNPFKELSNDELTEVRAWLMDPQQSLNLKDIDEAGLKDNYIDSVSILHTRCKLSLTLYAD